MNRIKQIILEEISAIRKDKKKEIKIAAFQETKLSEKVQLNDLGDFILIRKDRLKDTGGGVAFLIHKNISFQILPN